MPDDIKKPKRITTKQRTGTAHSIIQSAQKGLAEASRHFAEDNAQRIRDAGKLLHPTEILNGTHDAGDVWRRLMTTRGGQMRPLTIDDLKDFERLAGQLGNKYEKGITAKGVIDHSLSIDRDRAKKEIHTAIPIANKDGAIKFATNTGPKSDRERQYVMVRIADFEKKVVQPDTPEKIAAAMTRGKIQISCTCGRWRYWYAYASTIGGYNANPQHRESAYPRIRNPGLHGLACKHILRVMAVFSQTAAAKSYIARMVSSEQTKVKSILAREKMSDMHAFAEKIGKERSRVHDIKTTDEKRAARTPKTAKAVADLQKKAAAKAQQKQQRDTTKAARELEKNARQLLSLGAITQDQFNAMLAAVKKS